MRLIDADAAVKQLDPNTWQGEMLIAILNGLPTAYDVKKVIGQLERDSKLYSLSDKDCEFAIPQNVAIEIVKGGGKDA